jgi:hypothetical protein
MELDDVTAAKIKRIYDMYYADEITVDDAIHKLELIINGVEDE